MPPTSKTPAQRIETLETKLAETESAVSGFNEQMSTKFDSLDAKLGEVIESLAKKPETKSQSDPGAETKPEGGFDAEAKFNSLDSKLTQLVEGLAAKPETESKSAPGAEAKPEGGAEAGTESDTPDPMAALTEQLTEMKAELAGLKMGKVEAGKTKSPGDESSAVDGAGGASAEADAGGDETLSWLDAIAADAEVNALGLSADELEACAKGEDYSAAVYMKAELKFGEESKWTPEKAKQFAGTAA